MAQIQRYEVGLDTRLELVPLGSPDRIAPRDIWFEGRRFTWFPGTSEYYPVLAVSVEDALNSHAEAEAVERFLSALSYHTRVPIRSLFGSVAAREEGGKPSLFPRAVGIRLRLDPELIVTQEPRLRGCLALMREAMNSGSAALKFLSYWKVIELAVGQPNIKTWINEQRDRLRSGQGEDYRPDLGDDWYVHLNESRVAAAHAVPHKPGALRIDPDDPTLQYRLESDIGILSQLARGAIERAWPYAVRESYPPDDMLGRGEEWEALMHGGR